MGRLAATFGTRVGLGVLFGSVDGWSILERRPVAGWWRGRWTRGNNKEQPNARTHHPSTAAHRGSGRKAHNTHTPQRPIPLTH